MESGILGFVTLILTISIAGALHIINTYTIMIDQFVVVGPIAHPGARTDRYRFLEGNAYCKISLFHDESYYISIWSHIMMYNF